MTYCGHSGSYQTTIHFSFSVESTKVMRCTKWVCLSLDTLLPPGFLGGYDGSLSRNGFVGELDSLSCSGFVSNLDTLFINGLVHGVDSLRLRGSAPQIDTLFNNGLVRRFDSLDIDGLVQELDTLVLQGFGCVGDSLF
jgi:hypothetical protein